MNTTTTAEVIKAVDTYTKCRRCKGAGRGDWHREYGVCFGCAGTGNSDVGKALKASTAAALAASARRVWCSVLVGPVDPAEGYFAAAHAIHAAFNEAAVIAAEGKLAPGWHAFTVLIDPDDADYWS